MASKRSFLDMIAPSSGESSSDESLPDLIRCDSTSSVVESVKRRKTSDGHNSSLDDSFSTVTLSDDEDDSVWWSDFDDLPGEEDMPVFRNVQNAVAAGGPLSAANDCNFCQQVMALNAPVQVHPPPTSPQPAVAGAAEQVQILDISQIKKEEVSDDDCQQGPVQGNASGANNLPELPTPDYDSDDVQIVGYVPPGSPAASQSSVIEILETSFSDESTFPYSDDEFYQNQLADPQLYYIYQDMLNGKINYEQNLAEFKVNITSVVHFVHFEIYTVQVKLTVNVSVLSTSHLRICAYR